ncbi:MAG: RNA polymerase sigma factor [Phycisphaerae bacterium]
MPRGAFWTETGGPNRGIQATHWTQILMVQGGDTSQRQAALGLITRQYWKPVYTYLVRKGFRREQAKDITQGFFTDVILGRGLVAKAAPEKGRFRSFLLTAVNNYANDVLRRQSAASRHPREGLVSLEGMEYTERYDPPVEEPPEDAFHREWAAQLLEEVIADVESQCRRLGQQKHWEVFRRRVLLPVIHSRKAPAFADVANELDIPSPTRAMTMNDTVRRKFETTLRRHVRPYVETARDVDDEIRQLIEILSVSSPARGRT